MMQNLPSIGAGVIGALALLASINWVLNPAGAAASLGMPLLEGVGRSTQLGDLTAFFTGIGVLSIVGAWRKSPTLLLSAALFLGLTAIFRTLAWAVHGADFATAAIVAEVILCTLLVLCAKAISGVAQA